MTVSVICSYFVDISKTGNGGAIEISEKRLFVSFSYFTNLSVTTHGGSIYAENSHCKVAKTCFYGTYSTKHQDNTGCGNAIYIVSGVFLGDNINVRRCGITEDLCTDSSVKTLNNEAKVQNYNSTYNFGINGAAGISIIGAVSGSYIRFINVVDTFDTDAIESSALFTAYSCNFINTSGCISFFLYSSSDNTIKFDTCVFIETKSPFSSSNKACLLVNCIADTSITGMSYKENPDTIFITIILMHQCTKTKRSNRLSSFISIGFILLVVST